MFKCLLCKSSKEDDVQYGDVLQNERMAVHTFCLYLSSNLPQNGKDDEGFLGFLEADIKKESRRVSFLQCCYCRERYANVGCCRTKCRHTFHLICGLENGAQNQFCGSYQSFCHKHTAKYTITIPPKNVMCVICFENLPEAGKRINRLNTIQAPCCRNGWFHKLCLQRSAKMAGYFFKCPLCNDVQVFRQKLSKRGVFIPNQDAAWELEPNAFAELLERPNECTASVCLCNQGRSSSSTQNPLIYCSMCGSNAMHKNCIPNRTMRFHCADCAVIIEEGRSQANLSEYGDNQKDNDDEIDVCNVSDHELETLKQLFPSTQSNAVGKEVGGNTVEISLDAGVRSPIRSRTRLLSSDSSDSKKKCQKPPPSRRRTTSSDDDVHISESNRSARGNRVLLDTVDPKDDYTQSSISSNETQRYVSNRKVEVGVEVSEEGRKYDENSDSMVTISSDEIFDSRRSRSRRLQSGDEDDNESQIPEKQTKLHSNRGNNNTRLNLGEKRFKESEEDTKEKEQNNDSQDENSASSTDSDDDPLEYFNKFLQKQKNSSFIAQRTRNKLSQKNPSKVQTSSAINNSGCLSKIQDNPKSIKFQTHQDQENDNKLDISCIAQRTRCRTTDSKSTVKGLQKNESILSSNIMRSRRLTICSQTPNEKSKQSTLPDANHRSTITTQTIKETIPDRILSCEMSPIYERNDFTTDDETETHHLKISRAAKRTRKRQSQKLQNIEEEDECTAPSCNTAIFKKQITDLRSATSPRRLRPRIMSISSDDTENINYDALKICAHQANEKMPKVNFEAAYHRKQFKLRNSSAYNPSKLRQFSY